MSSDSEDHSEDSEDHSENGSVPYIPPWGGVYGVRKGNGYNIPIDNFTGQNLGIHMITTYAQAMEMHISCLKSDDALRAASWFSIASNMLDRPPYITPLK